MDEKQTNKTSSMQQVSVFDIPRDEITRTHELIADLFSPEQFKEDVYYLKRVGKISVRAIANQLGITRSHLYFWMCGQHCPRNPYYFQLVHLWARALRRQIEETGTEGEEA